MRGVILCLASLSLLIGSCTGVRIHEQKEWGAYFSKYGVDGCIEIYDNNKEIASFYNKERVAEQLPPASTFKIFNSLVALETGIAPDEQMVLPWDGQERSNPLWNQDLNMAEAFELSAVPYYQELARRIGNAKMQYFLDTVKYGNMKIGNDIDAFWLDGSLRISADEQVGFMKRLYHDELSGFSERSNRIVRGLMLQETGKNFRLYYKTGTIGEGKGQLFWLVGFLEHFVPSKDIKTKQANEVPHPYFFAMNFSSTDSNPEAGAHRVDILKEILQSQNVILQYE